MSKGFAFHREKRLLLKVIQAQDKHKFQSLVQKLMSMYGAEKVTNWVVNDILPSVDSASMAWAYKTMGGEDGYNKMTEKSLETIFQILVQKGFIPGKDFSIHPKGGFILSDECSEALLQEVPEQHRQQVRSEILQVQQTSDPQTALETHLGVPFIDNLLTRVESRILEMSDTQAAGYLACLGVGVEARTQIELFPILMRRVQQRFPQQFHSIWEAIKGDRCGKPGPEVGIDLIIAAGGESEVRVDPDVPGNYLISHHGLKILATVCQGEHSIYDLIAAFDAHQRKQKGGGD